MRRFFQWLLRKPVTWFANKVSSSPEKQKIFASLDKLYADIIAGKESAGCVVPFNIADAKFVIVSDQHKGGRDFADDFRLAENNYRTALQYYYDKGFTLISVGDCEELWENTPSKVIETNRLVLLEEARFLQQGRYHRMFGNHDLEWKYEIQQNLYLKPVFGDKLKVCEGLLLNTTHNGQEYNVFITHGHQGDQKSDGNWFSTWVVAALWTPIQRFLEISINTTSDSFELIDKHNVMMYEWSATQKNMIFVSGHTHKPVFASLDHVDRLNKQLLKATELKEPAAIKLLEDELKFRQAEYAGKKFHKTLAIPSYFNTGCCCFADGDISLIEINGDNISLVKWQEENKVSERIVLEHAPLSYVLEELS
ncbi:MAG: metallophosphoesterase [Chitinophagaceae bacterium]|nr:metallophosphoesterase [Chitinophagaceae bacterium]